MAYIKQYKQWFESVLNCNYPLEKINSLKILLGMFTPLEETKQLYSSIRNNLAVQNVIDSRGNLNRKIVEDINVILTAEYVIELKINYLDNITDDNDVCNIYISKQDRRIVLLMKSDLEVMISSIYDPKISNLLPLDTIIQQIENILDGIVTFTQEGTGPIQSIPAEVLANITNVKNKDLMINNLRTYISDPELLEKVVNVSTEPRELIVSLSIRSKEQPSTFSVNNFMSIVKSKDNTCLASLQSDNIIRVSLLARQNMKQLINELAIQNIGTNIENLL